MGCLVISQINHASEAKAMSAKNERSLRASTVTVIWQKASAIETQVLSSLY